MGSEFDLQKSRRELVRWRILRILDCGRPLGVGEGLILQTLVDSDIPLTQFELRRELDYLRDRDLLTLKSTRNWHAELTRYGVDVVEYTVDCHPGIARPDQV